MPVETHATIDALEPEWDALATRLAAEPFLRPGWMRCWIDAFGRGRLEVLAVRRGGELVGVVPLLHRGGAVLSPTNWHTPGWGLLTLDEDAADELAEAIFAARPRRALLSFLGPGGDAIRRQAQRYGYLVDDRPILRSPTLELAGDFDSYMAARSKKRTKELTRQRNRLESLGELTFECVAGDARLTEAFAIEGSGWKIETGTAILADPPVERFYRGVAAWGTGHGMWHTFFLRLDGRPIAAELALVAHGALYNLKGGYDTELRAYAPGIQIARELVRWSYEHGLRRFELLGQVEPQKLYWTDEIRERHQLHAFAPTPAGRLVQASRLRGRPLAKRLIVRALSR